MSLIMTILVRDEYDIIKENIEFHLSRGVDHIIATDNASKDGTLEILEEYERKGCLTLIQEPSSDYHQERWVNRMVLMAKERFSAGWVINNDADEFWRPPDGYVGQPGDLKRYLAGTAPRLLSCRRYNMIAARC